MSSRHASDANNWTDKTDRTVLTGLSLGRRSSGRTPAEVKICDVPAIPSDRTAQPIGSRCSFLTPAGYKDAVWLSTGGEQVSKTTKRKKKVTKRRGFRWKQRSATPGPRAHATANRHDRARQHQQQRYDDDDKKWKKRSESARTTPEPICCRKLEAWLAALGSPAAPHTAAAEYRLTLALLELKKSTPRLGLACCKTKHRRPTGHLTNHRKVSAKAVDLSFRDGMA